MQPIAWCSFGGYTRWSAVWWNDLAAYVCGVSYDLDRARLDVEVPGWMRDVYTIYHRARYGWAPADVLDLDCYLNRVLGSTLAHLAETTQRAPYGYPYLDVFDALEEHADESDLTQWKNDLRKWSETFRHLHAWQTGSETVAPFDGDLFAHYYPLSQTLRELAPWWRGLWLVVDRTK